MNTLFAARLADDLDEAIASFRRNGMADGHSLADCYNRVLHTRDALDLALGGAEKRRALHELDGWLDQAICEGRKHHDGTAEALDCADLEAAIERGDLVRAVRLGLALGNFGIDRHIEAAADTAGIPWRDETPPANATVILPGGGVIVGHPGPS